MYGVQKQSLKHLSSNEYKILRTLCFTAKNMYNTALYNIRQRYFADKSKLSYTENYKLCKTNENYRILNSNAAQQLMKIADQSFQSFLSLCELAGKGEYSGRIKMPKYLKKDSFFMMKLAVFCITGGFLTVPMSRGFKEEHGKMKIKVPSNLIGRKINEIRIIPRSNARFFEVQYVYKIEASKETLNKNNSLAIDLGINNLAACVTNTGKSFIIDGRRLKSINAHANKVNARLQSIKDRQGIKETTKAQEKLWTKRNNRVNDYLNKAARLIIDYCRNNDIGTLILGYNRDIQRNSGMGRRNNQNFVNIPIAEMRNKLKYLSERYNIAFSEQEESYTSKADFLSGDAFDGKAFSGKRIKRGLYLSGTGVLLNADCNGALNILRKSEAKINLLYREYISPTRLRVA